MTKLIVAFHNFVNKPENVFDSMDGGLKRLRESSVGTAVLCIESV
jgi:hypothetical protein